MDCGGNSPTCSCIWIMLYELTGINFRPGFSDNDKSSDNGMGCHFIICCYWDVCTGLGGHVHHAGGSLD